MLVGSIGQSDGEDLFGTGEEGDSCPVFVRRGGIISLVVMDGCVFECAGDESRFFRGALPPSRCFTWPGGREGSYRKGASHYRCSSLIYGTILLSRPHLVLKTLDPILHWKNCKNSLINEVSFIYPPIKTFWSNTFKF
jgi:hypothetical protein